MALTIKYTPGDYFSAHGDLVFTVLEDTKPFNSTTYPDYKYVADLYVNGTDFVARLKAFPRPGDKIGIFDISNIVRSYLDFAFAFTPNDIRAREAAIYEFFVNFRVNFGEEYNFTTYPNLVIDSQRTYFNSANVMLIDKETLLEDYLDKALTIRPYSTSVYRLAKYCLIPFFASDDTVINVIVKTYNSLGLIGTATFPISPTSGTANTLQVFNISPASINASSPNFINDYVDYYTVELNTTNITGDSIYRFNLVCERKYEVFTLHFLNRFGGVESKDFTKVSRKRKEIERSDYVKSGYTIDSLGQINYNKYNSKTYNESKSTFAIQYSEKMILNTDVLTDLEYEWIGDLFTSPMVYMEIQNTLMPVTITESTYEPKKIINDKLTNITLNLEFGKTYNTQYR